MISGAARLVDVPDDLEERDFVSVLDCDFFRAGMIGILAHIAVAGESRPRNESKVPAVERAAVERA